MQNAHCDVLSSDETEQATKALVLLLEKQFEPAGQPPQMACWEFDIPDKREWSTLTMGEQAQTFRGLLAETPADPVLAEAIENIATLREVAAALRRLHRLTKSPEADLGLIAAFNRLLDHDWMSSWGTGGMQLCETGQQTFRQSYHFAHVSEAIRDALLQAVMPEGDV